MGGLLLLVVCSVVPQARHPFTDALHGGVGAVDAGRQAPFGDHVQAVADLDFETAALLRDEVFELEKLREHETSSRMKTDPEFKAKVKLAEKHTRWEGKKKGRKLIKE